MRVDVCEMSDAMRDIETLCPKLKVGCLYVRPDNRGTRSDYFEVSVEEVESGDLLFIKDYADGFEASAVLHGIRYGIALALGKEI